MREGERGRRRERGIGGSCRIILVKHFGRRDKIVTK